jgi:hypothetical protein
MNEKGAQREEKGIGEDNQNRGLQIYSENGLHRDGCLAGFR